MATRAFDPFVTYFNANKAPAAGHKFYFYEVGTNTLKTIYNDKAEQTEISNPAVVLNNGQLPEVFIEGQYRVIWKDQNGKQVKEVLAFGGDIDSQLSLYTATSTYNTGDLVTGSDGCRYQSLIDGNTGNDPTISPTKWVKVIFVISWSSIYSFSQGDITQGSDGNLYRAVIANTGNNPTTDDGTNWASATTPYKTGDVALGTDATNFPSPQWLKCDGSAFSSATYSALAAILPDKFDPITWAPSAVATIATDGHPHLSWTTDDVYLAQNFNATPYIAIFKRTGDTFAKLANPATLPTGGARCAAFAESNDHLSVGHFTSPFMTVYSRSGDVFTKLANPATLPTNGCYGTDWTSDAGYVFFASATSPYILGYSRSGSTLTKLADPATLPTGTGRAVAVSPDDGYIAFGYSAGNYIIFYSFSAGSYTKLSDPATLPTGAVLAMAWDDTSTYLAVASTADKVIFYKNVAGVITKLADPATLPGVAPIGVTFDSVTKTFTFVSNTGSIENSVTSYKIVSDVPEKIPSVLSVAGKDDIDGKTPRGAAYSRTGAYLAIEHSTSPNITMTKPADILPDLSGVDSEEVVQGYIKTGL